MKDLLFSVMAVSLFSGGVLMLAPEGGAKKQMAFLASLILCLGLFTPLFRLAGKDLSLDLSLPDTPTYEEGSGAILTVAVEHICRELEADVSARFAVKDALLSLTYDDGDPTAVVFVSGSLRGRGQVEQAAAYLEELLNCPVDAVYSDEEAQDGIS